MLEEFLNTLAFRFHLKMLCVIIKKYLVGYFEFLYGSGVFDLPLNIPEKTAFTTSFNICIFEKPE